MVDEVYDAVYEEGDITKVEISFQAQCTLQALHNLFSPVIPQKLQCGIDRRIAFKMRGAMMYHVFKKRKSDWILATNSYICYSQKPHYNLLAELI